MTNSPIYKRDGFTHLMNLHLTPALTDAACMHAISFIPLLPPFRQRWLIKNRAMALSHLSILKLKSSSSLAVQEAGDMVDEAFVHIFEAVRLLNKKFEDPKEALSSTTLYGVALMATCAAHLGNKVHLETHSKGMIRMIELRGGIDTLPRKVANQLSRYARIFLSFFLTKAV